MLNKGDKVKYKKDGKIGEVTGNTMPFLGGVIKYEINFSDKFSYLPETVLEKVLPSLTPIEKFKSGEGFLNYEKYRQYMTYLRMQAEYTNIYYSMKKGSIKFFPYQYKPVIKFIESDTRKLLIADEVGLGKTIEALLIWEELTQREGANRLLVVTPAILTEKWRSDMIRFFGIKADIVDAAELEKRLKEDDGFVLITSIQGIRVGKSKKCGTAAESLNYYLEKLSDNVGKKLLDLVIFDEAHYLVNKKTANFKTAERIDNISEAMLLLSATPINNKNTDLLNLLMLLSPDEFYDQKSFDRMYEKNKKIVKLASLFASSPKDSQKRKKDVKEILKKIEKTHDPIYSTIEKNLDNYFKGTQQSCIEMLKIHEEIIKRYFYSNYFTRSRKKDVLDKVTIRKAQTVKFKFSSDEKKAYNKAIDRLKEMLKAHGEDSFLSFSILARQRELSSCLPATIKRWKDKGIIEDEEEDFCLIDDSVTKKDLNKAFDDNSLNLGESVVLKLEENDSKFDQFYITIRDKLSKGSDGKIPKIVVFSFFRGTLQYLQRRLKEKGIETSLIIGGMKNSDKENAIDIFKTNENVNVLLSSEVGTEGIDLQFSRIEFNYDLPWNPMKLEQRIGRIDRIGQKSDTVSIVNFICSDTVEDRVLAALYDKIKIFESGIGEIDDILGQQTEMIQRSLLESDKSDEEKIREAKESVDKLAKEVLNEKMIEDNAWIKDGAIEYVNTADINKRYLQEDDYVNYINDFLDMYGQGSTFKKKKNSWMLDLSPDDSNDFASFIFKNKINGFTIPKGEISCSFPSSKYGFASWKIDVNHPFIKWINKTIENKKEYKGADSYVLHVDKDKLDNRFQKNAYVFYSAHSKVLGGIRRSSELDFFLVSVNSKETVVGKDAEYLLNNALYFGHSSPVPDIEIKPILSEMRTAIDICKEAYIKNSEEKEKIYKEDNELCYMNNINRINDIYGRKELTIKHLIDDAKDVGVKKMNEGKLKKNKEIWDLKIKEIENKRNPNFEVCEICFGVLFID